MLVNTSPQPMFFYFSGVPDNCELWLNDEYYFSVQLIFVSVVTIKCGFLELGNSFTFILGDKVALEGKVEHKFDMKPRHENIEDYGKLCRERTKKSMIKNRQVQVAFHVYN
jgi:hypothetical protein